MKIITVTKTNQKGGTGKTSITMNLGVALTLKVNDTGLMPLERPGVVRPEHRAFLYGNYRGLKREALYTKFEGLNVFLGIF